jgi:hypothetical protein
MKDIHDLRVVELQRLRLALTRAARHLDEFETQLKQSGAARIWLRDLMARESSFANYVAARGRSALVEENGFAANVVSVREPDSRANGSRINSQREHQA